MHGSVCIRLHLPLVQSQGGMPAEFIMFAVYLHTEHLSIYVLEQQGWLHGRGPLHWVGCSVITVLKFLVVFIKSLHFYFALRHANYIAIPEHRGWQVVPAKSQVVNTLVLRAKRASSILCKNLYKHFFKNF